MTADVIVIGGGIMGLSTAWHLAEANAGRIVLLERRFIGAGSSGKSGAILRQHYSHETTVRMARSSLAFYRDFESSFGHDIGFRNTGMAVLCHAGDRAALEANLALQRSLGVEAVLLDVDGLRDMEPRALIDDDTIGALEPEAGFVNPGRTLAALTALVRSRGVEVHEHAEVVDIALDGQGRVAGVALGDGSRLATSVVVNAGGPWAGRLCRRLGHDVPLTAIRPEQAYFVPPARYGRDRLIVGDLLTGLYWKPEPAGWTRVGKLAYDGDQTVPDPDHYDEGVSDAFIEMCRERMSRRLPDYRDAVSWGGGGALYTVTPDAHALIGALPGVSGFYLVSGFSGHGFKLGPAVGCGVAAMITGAGSSPFDPAFFAVDRFDRGLAVTSRYQYGILG